MTDITDCNLPQKVMIGFIRGVVFFSGAAFNDDSSLLILCTFFFVGSLKNGSNKTNEV